MIRIIYFCPSESMYGDNIALLNIIPLLKEKGVVPFFVVSFEGELTKYLSDKGYDFIVCHNRIWNLYDLESPFKNFIVGGLWRLKHFWNNKKTVRVIAEKLREFNADLVHSNSSNSSFGFYLAKELGVKHVWHLREYGKLDANKQYFPSLSYFIKRLNSELNYTISITPQVFEYFQRSKQRDVVIYDGVVDKKNMLPFNYEKEKYFLYVGRLFDKKGVEMIIDAFSQKCMIDTEYKLLLVGSGEGKYVDYLKEKVKENHLDKRIVFCGYRKDVSILMSRAKALIVASDFEAFGFITAEAMFAGCYVIGRDSAGTKLQFDNMKVCVGHEVGARFVTPVDLADILDIIMSSKIDVMKDLIQIQSKVTLLYGIDKSAQSVYSYYNKILK